MQGFPKKSTPLRWVSRFHRVSSFAVSAVCHAVVLIALALIPLVVPLASQLNLVAILSDAEPEVYELEIPLQEIQVTPTVQVIRAAAAGSAALSERSAPAVNRIGAETDIEFESVEGAPGEESSLSNQVPGQPLRPVPLRVASGRTGKSADQLDRAEAENAVERMHRDAVRRFILYDIGQLTGQAGAKARQDFAALGEDAIPALVWGLNQSAYLNQSCPVIVIQSKLAEELSASDDPKYLRYALENIGRGVPSNAPYADRLASFRGQLAGAPVSRVAAQRSERRKDLVRQLGRTPNRLREFLQAPDPDVRWAAIRIVASRGIPHVTELADLLVDSDPEIRHEAHEALMRLSRGEDYGPLDLSHAGHCRAAQQLWKDWWEFARDERADQFARHRLETTDEDRAAAALRLAENLEQLGKTSAAQTRYRDIVSRFPDTDVARTARERILQ